MVRKRKEFKTREEARKESPSGAISDIGGGKFITREEQIAGAIEDKNRIKFQIGNEAVSKEEFQKRTGKTMSTEEERKEFALQDAARRPEFKEQQEVTRLQEQRRAARGEEQTTTETTAPETIGQIQEQALLPDEQLVAEQQQEFHTDPITGEVTPLFSGQASPITEDDIFQVAALFSGIGLPRAALSIGGKSVLKGGLIGASKSARAGVRINMLKGISTKLKSVIKASSKKLSIVAIGVGVGAGTTTAGALIAPLTFKRVTAPDRQIQSIDTSLSQIRETITAPVQLVATGVPVAEGLDMLDDMRESVLLSERKIKELELKSQELKTNPEFTSSVKNRIAKLKLFLDLSERQILQMQVSGKVPTSEELQVLLSTYEEQLK